MKKTSDTSSRFIVRGRIWIDSDNGPFVGAGRIQLLKNIIEHGSISKAAKSMGMAYRQAWHLIESMNAKVKKPLVVSVIGGKGGGGATVTEEGLKVIGEYEKLEAAFTAFLKVQSDNLTV